MGDNAISACPGCVMKHKIWLILVSSVMVVTHGPAHADGSERALGMGYGILAMACLTAVDGVPKDDMQRRVDGLVASIQRNGRSASDRAMLASSFGEAQRQFDRSSVACGLTLMKSLR